MSVLHMELVGDRDRVFPETVWDGRIGKIIEDNASEDYSAVLAEHEEWDVYYHLSEVRKGLLNWYGFEQGCRVLEIEAEFGALTGLLCDLCGQVAVSESNPYRAACIAKRFEARENLDVYAGHVFDIFLLKEQEKFDYIIINGILERQGNGDPNPEVYAAYLRRIRDTFLRPGGRFLIAAENRLGLRYFCGERDRFTGRPFDSINNYPFGSGARGFTRKELKNIIERAGMNSMRFYYPLPDHRVPQIIFSQDYVNQTLIEERLSTYSVWRDTQVAWERALYKDVVENQAFEFMANSFLVECSCNGPCSDVKFAIVSTDRGYEDAQATIAHMDKTVDKIALYAQGRSGLQLAKDIVATMAARGIPTIPHEVRGHGIRMPYVDMPTLNDHLKKIFKTDKRSFLRLFDRLYHYILMSSELTKENGLANYSEHIDFGPILKDAYIDMIPANAFFDGEDIFFYDQAFLRSGYPARYVIYRAIKYTYMYIDGLSQYITMDELKARFWISDELWDIFEEVEAQFIASVRKNNVSRAYQRCVLPNLDAIHSRGEILTYKGESFQQYEINDSVRTTQRVLLKMLAVFQDVCERHGLRFFLIYGSLLGAVRHSGFVPWDDDVDVAMEREDYQKLMEIAEEVFPAPYFLQTMYNDEGSFFGGYNKLRDSSTTALEKKNWRRGGNQGISLDIIPIDNAYSEDKRNLKMLREQCRCQRMLMAKAYGDTGRPSDVSKLSWKMISKQAAKYTWHQLCDMLDKSFTACDQKEGGIKAIFAHYTGGLRYLCYDQHDFDSVIKMEFENLLLPIPGNYRHCLSVNYGEDFLRYPAVAERKRHHQTYIRTDVPYDIFLRRLNNFEIPSGYDLVLYGSGTYVREFLESGRVPVVPSFIISENREEWGAVICGISVKRPEAIGEPGPEPHHVIICDREFEICEKHLREMGCNAYAIYLPDTSVLWNT